LLCCVSFQVSGKHSSNMFVSFKNKIKEETGSDPTKLALSSPPQKIIYGSGSSERHSREGSGSSLGSSLSSWCKRRAGFIPNSTEKTRQF